MPYRIVVADPSASVRKVLQIVLPEPEFRLFPVANGEELCGAFAENDPDAAIVSLTLPGLQGGNIGRTLREMPCRRDLPLIGIQGAFEPFDGDPAGLAGFDAVFRKPFDSNRLADTVFRLIASKGGPSTIPELAGWDGGPAAAGDDGERSAPRLDADVKDVPPAVKRFVRDEVRGMARELEKRLRAGLLEDLKGGPGPGNGGRSGDGT